MSSPTYSVVMPGIGIGQGESALPDAALASVERVVVDSHVNLPDMFEITFLESAGHTLELTGIEIGSLVTIVAPRSDGTDVEPILVGEVTSIEGVFAEARRTVVRGYSAEHRLQRVRRTRAFLNMKKSDIARKIARDAGLKIGEVQETKTAHDHLGQVNQTDWDFLSSQARSIGFEVGVRGGEFTFRKSEGTKSAGATVELSYPYQLLRFAPRVSGGNLPSEAEVRVWDPMAAKVTSATAPVTGVTAELPEHDSAALAGTLAPKSAPPPPPAPPPQGVADMGPAPSATAFVVSDWPIASGSAIGAAADEAVAAVAHHIGGTFAEAEGQAVGDSRLLAGAVVDVSGISPMFAGKWSVTRARHVFEGDGYFTFFEVSGHQERSLLGLVSRTDGHRGAPLVHGLVCGIVTNNNDPDGKCRVKVTLPWLSPDYETDWSPVAQAGAGKRSGSMFMPEVGDEVLVGFEFGDPQRAYVIAGLVNDNSNYTLGGPAIKAKGQIGDVVWRGVVSASGSRLAFHDEMPPGEGQPPIASELVLGTGDGNLGLAIDQVGGTVTLTCKPQPPNSKSAAGEITIECSDMGKIDIRTGAGGMVNIDGGAQLTMKAQAAIKIESQGVVEIKGATVKLN